MKAGKIFVALVALFLILGAAGFAEAREFPQFSTTNFNDEVITNAIFAESDITMVYFWATWCPPCVAGKPVLAELYKSLGGKGLIGILIDVDNQERAQQILNSAEADFPQLRMNREIEPFIRAIGSIPTSIFVNSEGNIVGPTIVGSRSSQDYLRMIQAARENTNE